MEKFYERNMLLHACDGCYLVSDSLLNETGFHNGFFVETLMKGLLSCEGIPFYYVVNWDAEVRFNSSKLFCKINDIIPGLPAHYSFK